MLSRRRLRQTLFHVFLNKNRTCRFEFPKMISRYASTYKIEKFVHLSALGIENAKDSIYAQSKLKGEEEILKNFGIV